jgi:putative transposase
MLAELQRVLAATRKRSHGKLANEILKLGTDISRETFVRSLSKNIWQKRIKARSGYVYGDASSQSRKRWRQIIEFPTRSTKLSETCHCGEVTKKPLSKRQHVCACGADAQRDLYSAFLAKYVFDDVLNTRQALVAWPGANLLLERAVLRLQHEAAMGRIHPASFGLARAMKESTSADRRQSCSPVKYGSTTVEAGNVCLVARENVGIAVRTPWF